MLPYVGISLLTLIAHVRNESATKTGNPGCVLHNARLEIGVLEVFKQCLPGIE